MQTIEEYLLLFSFYAVLGWLCESLKSFLHTKKFINRGFFIGPYCPIYGFGALIITIFFKNSQNVFLTFWGSLVLCGLIEYFTSFIMEKMFKTRWWDYHYKKFNINGRICLEYLIYFGLAGLLIINVINPFIFNYLNLISAFWLHIISVLLIINYLIDCKWSYEIALHLKKIQKKPQDITEIDADLKRLILKKAKIHKRVLNAFPLIKEQMGEEISEYLEKGETEEYE